MGPRASRKVIADHLARRARFAGSRCSRPLSTIWPTCSLGGDFDGAAAAIAEATQVSQATGNRFRLVSVGLEAGLRGPTWTPIR